MTPFVHVSHQSSHLKLSHTSCWRKTRFRHFGKNSSHCVLCLRFDSWEAVQSYPSVTDCLRYWRVLLFSRDPWFILVYTLKLYESQLFLKWKVLRLSSLFCDPLLSASLGFSLLFMLNTEMEEVNDIHPILIDLFTSDLQGQASTVCREIHFTPRATHCTEHSLSDFHWFNDAVAKYWLMCRATGERSILKCGCRCLIVLSLPDFSYMHSWLYSNKSGLGLGDKTI